MSDQERLDQLEAEGLKMHTPEFERQIAETMADRGVNAYGRTGRHVVSANTAAGWVRVDGWYLRNVTDLHVRHAAGGVPVVTVSFLASRVTSVMDEGALDAAEARDREATK